MSVFQQRASALASLAKVGRVGLVTAKKSENDAAVNARLSEIAKLYEVQARSPFFNGFSDHDLEVLHDHISIISFDQGDTVMSSS